MSGENRAKFNVDPDGWIHLTPFGEFEHRTGIVQVIDKRACEEIVKSFEAKRQAAGDLFAGVLLDYDHFSLDLDKSSEAAGWIVGLEVRDDGLWGKVRWSDAGVSAVTGGRYRFVSLVFPPAEAFEVVEEGTSRKRPLSIVSCALTNEPNIKGGKPIANRVEKVSPPVAEVERAASEVVLNRETAGLPGVPVGGKGAKRYMWLLGATKTGTHCPSCTGRNGLVKTLLEWMRMPAPYCQCQCHLAEVGVDVAEDYKPAEFEAGGEELENRVARFSESFRSRMAFLQNRWTDAARAARKNFPGWSDEARAASAESRRSDGGESQPEAGGKGSDGDGKEADGFAAAFIRQYEGFKTDAYPDPATGGAPWTVGYGSTRGKDGKPVKPGDRVTREEAEGLLLRDMKKESAGLVGAVPWGKLSPRQQASLMSWAYNIGGGAAASSTLARRLAAGEDPAVVIREELPRWNKAGGRVMRGLAARRLAEVALAEVSPTANRWSAAARAASAAARLAQYGSMMGLRPWGVTARAAAALKRSPKKFGGAASSPRVRTKVSPSSGGRDKGSDVCYRCGGKGHWAKDCPGATGASLSREEQFKRAARAEVARSVQELPERLGGYYRDGKPVVRDLTLISGLSGDPMVTRFVAPGDEEAEAALRRSRDAAMLSWVEDYERTVGAIEAFHAIVGLMAGAASGLQSGKAGPMRDGLPRGLRTFGARALRGKPSVDARLAEAAGRRGGPAGLADGVKREQAALSKEYFRAKGKEPAGEIPWHPYGLRDLVSSSGGDPREIPGWAAPDPRVLSLARRSPVLRAGEAAGRARIEAAKERLKEFLKRVPSSAGRVESYAYTSGEFSRAAKNAVPEAEFAVRAARARLSRAKDGPTRAAYEVRLRGAEGQLEDARRAARGSARLSHDIVSNIKAYLDTVRSGNPLSYRIGDEDVDGIWRSVRESAFDVTRDDGDGTVYRGPAPDSY